MTQRKGRKKTQLGIFDLPRDFCLSPRRFSPFFPVFRFFFFFLCTHAARGNTDSMPRWQSGKVSSPDFAMTRRRRKKLGKKHRKKRRNREESAVPRANRESGLPFFSLLVNSVCGVFCKEKPRGHQNLHALVTGRGSKSRSKEKEHPLLDKTSPLMTQTKK